MSPPYLPTRFACRLRHRLSTWTTSSGGRLSENSVKPRMSENNTVMVRRSPADTFFGPAWIISIVDSDMNFCMSDRSRNPRVIWLND